MEQALGGYLLLQASQLGAIAAGMKAANAGQVVPHDAVVAWVDSWDTRDECHPHGP
ncbi:MAG: hypothetical protein K5Q68_10650 [Roseococcus sp.]|nr:hypothetical protein [Roseococcus sp.]